MDAKAYIKNVRVTPRKARLVVDLVRGKSVSDALAICSNVNKAISIDVYKLIKSAAANATNNFKMDEDKLFIKEFQVGDGLRMKRFMPRAKGSASSLIKRTCNLYITVSDGIGGN